MNDAMGQENLVNVEHGPAEKRRRRGEGTAEHGLRDPLEPGHRDAHVHALLGQDHGLQGRAPEHDHHSALGVDVGESHRREHRGALRQAEDHFSRGDQGAAQRQHGLPRGGPEEGQRPMAMPHVVRPGILSSPSSNRDFLCGSTDGPPDPRNAPHRGVHGQHGQGLEDAGDAVEAAPRRSARRHRPDARGDPGADGHGERATAKRSRRDQGSGCQVPIWMEPPPWLYLPASGIVGGRQLRDGEDRHGPRVHGGSGAGHQTAAAALIRGRGRSPGRAGEADDGGEEHVGGGRISKRRDKEERLLGDHASISISLSDHAERVTLKAQRIREGTWPAGGPAEASAKEKLAALRERVRAKAARAAEAAEARDQIGESALRAGGGGGGPSDTSYSAIGGDAAQHRGEREQLDHELPLELRLVQANEASQMHSTFHFGDRAGGAGDDELGGAAGSAQAAEVAQRAEGWDEPSRSAGGAERAGVPMSTASAAAANFAAWHSNAAEETP